jgi:hypothetical protein
VTAHKTIKTSARKAMLYNFFIWLIPGIPILAISLLIIILFSLATPGVGGSGKDPFRRMPKGLASFLGIAHFLLGFGLVALIFIYEMDAEGLIAVISAAIVSFLIAYWAMKSDYQRLQESFQTED